MESVWIDVDSSDIDKINDKKIIFVNCLSLILPFIIYASKNKLDPIPTLSETIKEPLPWLIHLISWYYGYFNRMKILININGYYKYFYYSQLLGWLIANIFTVKSEFIFDIHTIATMITFTNFAIMKILFCKHRLSFAIGFVTLIYSYINKHLNLLSITERYCIYHVIFTIPDVSIPY